MLRISLQRFAQFATGRIRRGGHDSGIYGISPNGSAQSEILQFEKRPEPVQEVGRVLAFC
jgi:hypothetical protein